MDKILVQGLSVETLIGVYDWEREAKQSLILDLELCLDLSKASRSDDVADTIDYAVLADVVADVASKSQFQLLEAFAAAIIDAIAEQFTASAIRIRVEKPGILPNAQTVAVELAREL